MSNALLRRGFARFPNSAVVAADTLAWATRPARRGVTADEFAAVVPGLDDAQSRAASREAWKVHLRTRAIDAAVSLEGAAWPYPAVAGMPPKALLEPPLVLASMHYGPATGIGLLLERLDAPVVVLTRTTLPPRPGVEQLFVETDEAHRAAAMLRGVQTLRDGGFAYLSADGIGGRPVPATIFDRPVWFARGAFALARITGVPLLPVAPRWRGRGIEIVAGERIPPATESEMAARFAAWYERIVRASPGQLGLLGLAWLGASRT